MFRVTSLSFTLKPARISPIKPIFRSGRISPSPIRASSYWRNISATDVEMVVYCAAFGDKTAGEKKCKRFPERRSKVVLIQCFLTGIRSSFLSSSTHKFSFPSVLICLSLWTHTHTHTSSHLQSCTNMSENEHTSTLIEAHRHTQRSRADKRTITQQPDESRVRKRIIYKHIN